MDKTTLLLYILGGIALALTVIILIMVIVGAIVAVIRGDKGG